MRLLSTIAPLTLLVYTTNAAFENAIYYFAGNGGNSSKPRTCKGMPYVCDPPNMCVFDNATSKQYCCQPGNRDNACWLDSSPCAGGGSGVPNASQIGCTGGTVRFCCRDTEECTQRIGQFNVCWSKLQNPIALYNATRLNETFKALNATDPSAASYALADLGSQLSTTASSRISSATSLAVTSSAPATTSSSPPANTNSGLSGGAIGGIVGGVVGGLALLGLAGWLLWRRKKTGHEEIAQEEDVPELSADSKMYAKEADGHHLVELPRDEKPVELEQPPVEMWAGDVPSDRNHPR